MDFVAQFVLGYMMTRLARMVDVEQRTADPMAADFHGSLPFVGHVTIGARDSAASMNALAPELELRVLCFVDVSAGLAVFEVVELGAVWKRVRLVGLLDLLDLESFVPRVEKCFFARTIVLDMALATD